MASALGPLLGRLPGESGARAGFVDARRRLDRGQMPDRLDGVIGRVLSRADAAWAGRDVDEAADWLVKAQLLIFHPTRVDAVASGRGPAGDDALIAPLRASRAGRALHARLPRSAGVRIPPADGGPQAGGTGGTAPGHVASGGASSGGVSSGGETEAGDDRALRLLVLADSNWTFIDRVVRALAGRGQMEVTCLDLREEIPGSGLDAPLGLAGITRSRLGILAGRPRPTAPEHLREAIEQADVVWAEWGNQSLAFTSLLAGIGPEPGHTPLVTRIHRYEVNTAFPHLADWRAVSAALFVSAHVAEQAGHLLPDLAADQIHQTRNVNDLSRFHPEKSADADRTILHSDWARPVKDVEYAFDVLDTLLAADPAWRLVLVGEEPDPDTAYGRRARARAAAYGDRVEILGRREDMPEVYRGVGFVVSSSVFEGSHEVVVEGTAAGCVPVVRDWPDARPYGGAGGVYPNGWIVDTAEDAARRILDHADPAARAAEAERARTWVLRDRDPESIVTDLESILVAAARRSRS